MPHAIAMNSSLYTMTRYRAQRTVKLEKNARDRVDNLFFDSDEIVCMSHAILR